MAFSINTNVASLQAQNYLTQTQSFQSKTINEVTSGLRIVNSGDDAAGLAIANGFRSNEAVLTQGIQNANNGLSQLQIADGGVSNISSLLDRASTLATESASGAFTGNRTVLNSEFQSVVTEINRQAQSIGLNTGGTFAKALSVFIGGGQASGATSATTNGSVSIDLSQATVDAKSLGLEGVQATGATGTDIGDGSTTSVQNILSNSTNQGSITNNTTNFYFTGPGFSNTSGSNIVKVSVNLSGVTNDATLATALNSAIQATGAGSTQQATAFKNANITASITTDSTGKAQLAFSSANTAFQVQGGDQVSTALLGNFSSGSTGNVANVTAAASSAFAAPAAAETVQLQIQGSGVTGSQGDFSVALAHTDTATTTAAKINTAIAGNAALAATGIQAVVNGGKIDFVGHAGQSFTVATAGDTKNALGFGTFLDSTGTAATGGTFGYSVLDAAGASTAHTQGVQISINGGAAIDLGVLAGTGTENTDLATLNTAIQQNAALRAAGIGAADDGTGNIVLGSSTGTNFRVNLYGGTGDAFGFGASPAASTTPAVASTASTYAASDSINSSGAQSSSLYGFTGLTNVGDSQTISLSAVDANGNDHTLNVALTTANAGTLDQALSTINSAIASSNDSTLGSIAALKGGGSGSTPEGIQFLSAGSPFKVSLGSSPASASGGVVGLSSGGVNGGAVFTSAANGTGATADISNIATAQAAVSAIASAVNALGSAQAVIGRGENQFNYAVNLAQSQLTNFSAAESGIRDANLATESAHLTQAQIQLQAGIAALAQANSAPQQLLKLLQ